MNDAGLVLLAAPHVLTVHVVDLAVQLALLLLQLIALVLSLNVLRGQLVHLASQVGLGA